MNCNILKGRLILASIYTNKCRSLTFVTPTTISTQTQREEILQQYKKQMNRMQCTSWPFLLALLRISFLCLTTVTFVAKSLKQVYACTLRKYIGVIGNTTRHIGWLFILAMELIASQRWKFRTSGQAHLFRQRNFRESPLCKFVVLPNDHPLPNRWRILVPGRKHFSLHAAACLSAFPC